MHHSYLMSSLSILTNSSLTLSVQNSLVVTSNLAFPLYKSPVYTLQLSEKFNFQPSTTKPDSIGHPTIKTGQIWPLGWFSIF